MTFLLVTEHRRTGGIDVRAFYMRRILRIWPLYFLTVAIAFVVVPWLSAAIELPRFYHALVVALADDYWSLLALFVFMLPNLALRFYPPVLAASHAWSIGAEEQFYAVWPWFLRRCVGRLATALLLLIGGKLAFQFMLFSMMQMGPSTLRGGGGGGDAFVRAFWIENMAIGALGAHLLLKPSALTRLVLTVPAQLGALCALIAITAVGTRWSLVDHLAMPVAFLVLMLNLSTNPKSLFRLDSRLLSHLGKISYGLYMFHPLVLVIVLTLLGKSRTFGRHALFNAVLYASVLSVTVLLSEMSYRYLELPFMRRKARFAVVPSEPEPAPLRRGERVRWR
jgi:peptidoglycan/LPS O-acetylase OafA/YrhL